MYNIKLEENEHIELISDNTIIYNKENKSLYTSIITNNRYLILDYPSDIYNSKEDLRISQRINYIKQKEIIFEIEIKDIISIEKDKEYNKIILSNNNYIILDDKEIIKYLYTKINGNNKH